MAEKLICGGGLAGNPPTCIARELREAWDAKEKIE